MSAKSLLIPVVSVIALGVGAYGGYSYRGMEASQQVAETVQEDTSTVVARINGEDLTRNDVLALASDLPEDQLDVLLPALIDQIVDLKLMVQAAENAKLDQTPDVAKRLEASRNNILAEVFVTGEFDKRVDDAAIKKAYEDYLNNTPTEREVSARHILVESEEEAQKLIAELDGGADFVELARENSIGPSAPNGGDLGYFTAARMVPEFSAAAFSMKPGDHSSEPVRTQFGWHVIKVEDERESQHPSYEELEQQLKQQLSREAYEALVAELKNGAQIEILLNKPAEAASEENKTE
ncbi:peptidylprolyl isomerase [Kiloniella sp. b19]|uniref:peptidylprolyl isomerase n=1 Tax=Kiloniella sp. GXU_MW_B19 TaxID=3141326 RepID=UPI0031D44B6E